MKMSRCTLASWMMTSFSMYYKLGRENFSFSYTFCVGVGVVVVKVRCVRSVCVDMVPMGKVYTRGLKPCNPRSLTITP